MPSLSPHSVIDTLKRDVARAGLQARNGVKHVTGINGMKVAQTPKDVVWERRKTQVWRYQTGEVTKPHPVVIVYSLLSRSYMFDLYPGHSFVEHLGGLGYDVYLVDWGVADEGDSGNKLELYVDEHLPAALRAVANVSGTEAMHVIGYCFGGTLALMSLARNPRDDLAGLVLMAAPVDFHQLGLFTELLGPSGRLNPSDIIDGTGNVPASASRDVFRLMKPTSTVSAKVTLLERMWDDEFLKGYQAMGQWTRDNVPFPGAAFRQTALHLFRNNSLMDGTLVLGGRRVDCSAIQAPTLVLVAERDHIVPLDSALPGADVVGTEDVEVVRLPFGHVGLVMGRAAAGKTIPTLDDWFGRHTTMSSTEERRSARTTV